MIRVPSLEAITPTTPLRLETAAALAFPDGSMTLSALRRLVTGGKLDYEVIAGKIFVTLAAIEQMRSKCRVQAKASDSTCKKAKAEPRDGSSATGPKVSAQDALRANAKLLKGNLANTSSKSTTQKNPSAAVTPMPSKSRTP